MSYISAISDYKSHLGESPLWDGREQVLWWIDSLGPTLYQYSFQTQQTKLWNLPGTTIGSLAIREGGSLILAMDFGFYSFDPTASKVRLLSRLPIQQAGTRLNDGKVDPFGNFVVGTMNIAHDDQENCCMYRLDSGFEITELLNRFSCFNGPCFNPEDKRVYLTGRKDGVIEVFDYSEQQPLQNGSKLINNCNPDGATVDQEGFIWSAQWTNECIIRISPDGKIDNKITIPGQIISSVMFGGPDLDIIYVTTVGGQVGMMFHPAMRPVKP